MGQKSGDSSNSRDSRPSFPRTLGDSVRSWVAEGYSHWPGPALGVACERIRPGLPEAAGLYTIFSTALPHRWVALAAMNALQESSKD